MLINPLRLQLIQLINELEISDDDERLMENEYQLDVPYKLLKLT